MKSSKANPMNRRPVPKNRIPLVSHCLGHNLRGRAARMSLHERFQTVRSVGEDELLNLLRHNPHPICYDGFEIQPSSRIHIGQGVMKTININKLTSAGCHVKMCIADLFAQHNKMGGGLAKIRTVGEYMIEVWKALWMDIEGDKVEFLWSSDEISSRASAYWLIFMNIARKFQSVRMKR